MPEAPQVGEEVGVIQTNFGRIVVKFRPDKAPLHVKNFKELARSGFYDDTLFHRVIPGFMIQGGDPLTKDRANRARHGTGGPDKRIKAEFNDLKHTKGVLSAARSSDPNSAGSQFFLMAATSPHLDGQYSAYGEVVEGLEVIDTIVALPRDSRDNPNPANPAILESVTIHNWPLE
ncbi:MAG: peptidylprolyl isomerase [Fimbriimonas sp.]